MTERYVASYARVSTDRQEVQTQSDRLAAATPGARPFVDDGISGVGAVRPAFESLRGEILAGRVAGVFVTKLDRLGRSARGILEFFNEAEAHEVRVVVLDMGIDTSTPLGRFARTMAAGYAELERDLIAERTQETMNAFKAGTRKTRSGNPVGRPPKLTPELLAQIRDLRETPLPDGRTRTWAQIARMVHHPAGSCKKWLSAARRDKPRVINPPTGFSPTRGAPVVEPRA